MQEIGTLLKKERQEKGISLEEISRKTKIQVRFLQSLEEGDFSCFAGKVYIKGALRNYADAIGINAGELLSYYERINEEKSSLQKSEKENAEQKSELFQGKEKRSFPAVALIWIILLVVIFGGSIWYRYYGDSNGDERIPSQGVLTQGSQEEGEKEEETEITIPSPGREENPEKPQNSSPQLVQLSSDKREVVYLLKGVEKKELILYFTGKCWYQVEEDGAFIEQNTYTQGEVRPLPVAGRETKIRLGDPPYAWLEVNGLELNDWKEATNPVDIIIKKE